MKKLLTIAFFLLSFQWVSAQVEVKLNPINLLFSGIDASVEVRLSKHIALEPYVNLTLYPLKNENAYLASAQLTKGTEGNINAKYYFSDTKAFYGFYTGLYLRAAENKFLTNDKKETISQNLTGIGVSFGFKWVTRKNLVLGIDSGFGRKLRNDLSETTNPTTFINSGFAFTDLDGFFRFVMGFRFGEKVKKAEKQAKSNNIPKSEKN